VLWRSNIILSLLLSVHLQLIGLLTVAVSCTLQHHSSGGLHVFVSHNIVCNWFATTSAAHHGKVRFRIYFRADFYILFQRGQGIFTFNADNRPTPTSILPFFVYLLLNNVLQKEKMGEFIIPPYDFLFLDLYVAGSKPGGTTLLTRINLSKLSTRIHPGQLSLSSFLGIYIGTCLLRQRLESFVGLLALARRGSHFGETIQPHLVPK